MAASAMRGKEQGIERGRAGRQGSGRGGSRGGVVATLADPGRGGKQEVARARARAPWPHARPSVRGRRRQEKLRWWAGPLGLGQVGCEVSARYFFLYLSFSNYLSFLLFCKFRALLKILRHFQKS